MDGQGWKMALLLGVFHALAEDHSAWRTWTVEAINADI